MLLQQAPRPPPIPLCQQAAVAAAVKAPAPPPFKATPDAKAAPVAVRDAIAEPPLQHPAPEPAEEPPSKRQRKGDRDEAGQAGSSGAGQT